MRKTLFAFDGYFAVLALCLVAMILLAVHSFEKRAEMDTAAFEGTAGKLVEAPDVTVGADGSLYVGGMPTPFVLNPPREELPQVRIGESVRIAQQGGAK